MKAEKLLHLTLEENGYEEFVTKGSGFSQTIVEAMERYAKHYHESKVEKLNKADVMRSKFVFVRYRNWSGQEKIQAIAAENEAEARLWMKQSEFEIMEAKQIYFL